MINSLMKKIVNLSRNLLNQQSLHLFCLSDTDKHSHFTISVHQQCTGRTPKLRRHFNVNKPDSDWQAGPITATIGAGNQIPIWTSSCQIVPMINELLKADEELLLYRSGETSLDGFN